MNNHRVPTFEMDDDYSIPTPSNPTRPKKSLMAEEEIMELLWQNGQVIVQSQRKSPPNAKYDALMTADLEIRPSSSFQPPPLQLGHNPNQHQHQHQHQHHDQHHLFMQEDEMASWLHYPLVDEDPSMDLLYPAPTLTATTTTNNSAPPPPQPEPPPAAHARTVPSGSKSAAAAAGTVVDSCDTPAVRRSPGEASFGGAMATKDAMTSSPGDSSASAEPPPPPESFPAEDRKRKGVEADDAECQSEDVDFESADTKKQSRGMTSAKRSRAAEVHNLSERRRRDRINEKMKALQELIPRCNKSDKASMLDEAIEYLKSLQLQVQMMSMGCGMVPMMFPSIQQYMPQMGMGIGLGMGMGMEMGMNRPMMPFPNMLTTSAMTQPTAAAHLGPRFHVPAFHMPPVPPTTEPSRAQPTNQSDHMFQSFAMQNPNQSRMPNFADPYQQYLGSHQMMLPILQQNQAMVQPSTSKPSTTRRPENPENHQSG